MPVLIAIILLASGIVLLYYGSSWLVLSSSRLALLLGITPLIISLTVVSFGTSSPELVVSLRAALNGIPDLAVGNVVGSNICNVGLILGLSALVRPIEIRKDILRFDMPIMLAISFLLIFVAFSGTISFGNGVLLISLLLGYILLSFYRAKKERAEYVAGHLVPESKKSAKYIVLMVLLLLIGLLALIGGATVFLDGSLRIARMIGVSEAVIGLTVVALGTSLPELATSLQASWKKQADVLVGGIIGSNIFNILCILGISAVIIPLSVGNVTNLDIYVMIGFSLVLLPMMWMGLRIARWQGALLVLGYVLYMAYLFYNP